MCENGQTENENGKPENGNGNGNGHSLPRISPMQRKFLDAWFENGQNGTAAAKVCGYGNGDTKENAFAVYAVNTLSSPKILAHIKHHFNRHGGTEEEVKDTLQRQLRATPEMFMSNGKVDLELVRKHGQGIVKGLRYDKNGNAILTLTDPQRAAELIGKTTGMFKEVSQQTVDGNFTISFAGRVVSPPDAD